MDSSRVPDPSWNRVKRHLLRKNKHRVVVLERCASGHETEAVILKRNFKRWLSCSTCGGPITRIPLDR